MLQLKRSILHFVIGNFRFKWSQCKMITYSHAWMFPCTDHRSNILVKCSTQYCILSCSCICMWELVSTYLSGQIFLSFEISLAVPMSFLMVWVGFFFRNSDPLEQVSMIWWCESSKEYQSISVRMPMGTHSQFSGKQATRGCLGNLWCCFRNWSSCLQSLSGIE